MIEPLKKWIDQAVDAFLRGARGEAPPDANGKPAGKPPLILRDGLLVFIELVLTAAALFTCIRAANILVKAILLAAVLISAMRTYTAAAQLRDTLFGPLNVKK